ncbi:hypothetical protein BBJ28_00022354, partial [Nothophytophthora sp. Chile5]
QKYAEEECSIGFDRYSQLPFYLSVWVAKRKGTARLMLFSDHYMSDGFSGIVVLNCVLEQVSLLARQEEQGSQLTTEQSGHDSPTPLSSEFPLRPSLYRMWLKKVTWAKPLLKGTNALFGRRMFRGSVQKFTPLLAAREDQRDFAVPPVVNGTSALFADGDAVCMREALAKCKKECVTFGGALVAVVLLAFYRARSGKEQRGRFNPFKLTADLGYDMRQRVQHPVEEDQVGMYAATADLEWLATEGVDMLAMRFWDLAGRASREIEAKLKNTLAMAVPTMAADQKLNVHMEASFLKNVRVPHSLTADVDISNAGMYPYKKEHVLTAKPKGASGKDMLKYKKYHQLAAKSRENGSKPSGVAIHEKYQPLTVEEGRRGDATKASSLLSVESLHVYKAAPHLAASATIFVSSVHGFNYSMAHKCEAAVGEALFEAFVVLCESIGSIGSDETLVDVVERLDVMQ